MTRKNPKLKLPAKWTNAKIRTNPNGEVQIAINPAKLGSGHFAKGVKAVKNSSQHWRRGKDGQFHEVTTWPPKAKKKAKGTYRKSKYAKNKRRAA